LSLSSNSPLYFAHARSAPISRVIILFPFKLSGISFSAIFFAIHSTMAVLPTHGSHKSTGLFFVLLERICKLLLISSSLPITGSIFHFFACSTRSIPYFFRAFILFSGLLSVIFSQFLIVLIISSTFPLSTQKVLRIFFVVSSQKSISARKRCSSLIYSSFIEFALFSASSKTLLRSEEILKS